MLYEEYLDVYCKDERKKNNHKVGSDSSVGGTPSRGDK